MVAALGRSYCCSCERSRRPRKDLRGATLDLPPRVRNGIELESMEARMSAGQPVDPDQYGRLAGRLCRLFEMIGVRRLAPPVDPLVDLAASYESQVRAIDDDDGDEDEPAPPPLAADLDEPGKA